LFFFGTLEKARQDRAERQQRLLAYKVPNTNLDPRGFKIARISIPGSADIEVLSLKEADLKLISRLPNLERPATPQSIATGSTQDNQSWRELGLAEDHGKSFCVWSGIIKREWIVNDDVQ
jgi:hypothetical protein